jgi:hypothetical protein
MTTASRSLTRKLTLFGLVSVALMAFAAHAGGPAPVSFPVELKTYRIDANSHEVFLAYAASPGQSFCVVLSTSKTLLEADAFSRNQRPVSEFCVVADKAGSATVSAKVELREGLLLATVVLVTDLVRTNVIPVHSAAWYASAAKAKASGLVPLVAPAQTAPHS